MSEHSFDQRNQVVHGPQTNVAGGVYGPVLSGVFYGPVAVHYYPIKLRAPLRDRFIPLIENRTALFGGRAAICREIEGFIRDPAGGYLVITATAGFGKTALMAAVVKSAPEAFAYHFFTSLYGAEGLGEYEFLRNVVEQIAQWHNHKGELPTDLNELRALYQKFLFRSEPLERTQILILDGLDEVTGWKLAPYLSQRLSKNLHLILTIRDTGQDWLSEYQLPADQVRHLALGGLSRVEVAEVLRAAGPSGAAIASDPAALDELVERAAYRPAGSSPTIAMGEPPSADPFYVQFLAQDAREGKLGPEGVRAQPRGLDGYLEQWWAEFAQSTDSQPIADLLGTLTVALGPIGRADLETIHPSLTHPVRRNYFEEVAQQVRRWVVKSSEGLALAHPRLRLYLPVQIKTEAFRARLLAYCAGWAGHRSRYALSYYVRHLAEDGQVETLLATVKNLHYVAMKAFELGALAVEPDLLLAEACATGDDTIRLLRRLYTQGTHLLLRCPTRADLAATLYSRLAHIVEPAALQALVTDFGQTLVRPRITATRPLPDAPHPALVRTLPGHTREVVGCALSADGRTIVSASWDQRLRVWDRETGALRHVLAGHTNAVSDCALSADGQVIVSGGYDRTVRVWNAQSGALLRTLVGHTKTVSSCAVSVDGKVLVSGSLDGTLKVWAVDREQPLQTLAGHLGEVRGCALSAAGGTVLSAASDATLRVWDARSGACQQVLTGHEQGIWDCALSADGLTAVSASSDRTLRVWDTQTGAVRHTLVGHDHWVLGCALSADGATVISAGRDRTLRIWDAATGACQAVLEGHANWLRACAVSADGQVIVSASDDRTLKVWDSERSGAPAWSQQTDWAFCCAASADGATLAVGLADGSLKVLDSQVGAGRSWLTGHSGEVRGCAISADGSTIVSASKDGTLRVWDRSGSRLLRTLAGHAGQVWGCAISGHGKTVVSASDDRTLRIWDVTANAPPKILPGHRGRVRACALSADGSIIVSGSADATLRVWDTASGEQLAVLTGHQDEVGGCALSADGGVIVSGSQDRTLRVWRWDGRTATVACVLEGHGRAVHGCTVSRDGQRVFSASLDGGVKVWDAATGRCLATLYLDGTLYKCALLPDDERFVVAGARGIYFLRLLP